MSFYFPKLIFCFARQNAVAKRTCDRKVLHISEGKRCGNAMLERAWVINARTNPLHFGEGSCLSEIEAQAFFSRCGALQSPYANSDRTPPRPTEASQPTPKAAETPSRARLS